MTLSDQPATPRAFRPLPPLAGGVDRALHALARLSGSSRVRELNGVQLLMERAYLNQATFRSGRSAGGSCRLIPTRDAMLAVNLPRPSDWALISAWLETAPPDGWCWPRLTDALARRDSEPLIDRGRLLGLAVATTGQLPKPGTWSDEQRITEATRGVVDRTAGGAPRVVDLSVLWAGPLCGHLLHLAGADVIKVESVQRPDGARFGNSKFYGLLNQGKRSVALDLAAHRGRQTLRRLLLAADIVIESSRPRALRQMGIDAETIMRQRPGLTWISINGYGRTGPQANWIAFGDDAGVATGLSDMMKLATGRYEFAGDAIADPLTAVRAAVAAWRGWVEGGGRLISLALTKVAACSLTEERQRLGTEGVRDAFADWWTAALAGQATTDVRERAIVDHVSSLGEDTKSVLRELQIEC